MEAARARHRFPASAWDTRDEIFHDPYFLQNLQQLGYGEEFSRGYATPRRDPTLAGLVIGTIAGVVAALVLGNMIVPMW